MLKVKVLCFLHEVFNFLNFFINNPEKLESLNNLSHTILIIHYFNVNKYFQILEQYILNKHKFEIQFISQD